MFWFCFRFFFLFYEEKDQIQIYFILRFQFNLNLCPVYVVFNHTTDCYESSALRLSVYTVVHLTCGFFYTKKKVE